MKKIAMFAAAAVGGMLLLSGTAHANECGLNDRQLAAGWTCVGGTMITGTTSWVSDEQQGQSSNCAVYSADTTQTVWYAINPAGNTADDKTVYGEIELGDPYRDGAARCE